MFNSKMQAMCAALAFAGAVQAQQCPSDDDSRFISFQSTESMPIRFNADAKLFVLDQPVRDDADLKVDIVDHDYDAVSVSVNKEAPLPVAAARLNDTGPKKELTLRVGPRKSKAEVIIPEGTRLLVARTFKGNRCVSQSILEVVGGDSRVSAVIVGIEDYERMTDLKFAEDDADAFERLLRKRVPASDINIRKLVGSEATRVAIQKALLDVARSASNQATVLLYFSGHGVLIPQLGSKFLAYLVPQEVQSAESEPEYVQHSWLLETLKTQTRAKHRIVILDSCFSGLPLADEPAGEDDGSYVPKSISAVFPPNVRQLASADTAWQSIPPEILWFSGSSAVQVSYEAPELGHGVFTHYLLKAGETNLTYSRTLEQVSQALKEHEKGRQTPALLGNVGKSQTLNFPLTTDEE